MSAWGSYLDEKTDSGQHTEHPEWSVSNVWEFQRSDGLKTAHKAESPFMSWRDAVEESMKWADKHIPLGAELPEGMRSREDPLYDFSS